VSFWISNPKLWT